MPCIAGGALPPLLGGRGVARAIRAMLIVRHMRRRHNGVCLPVAVTPSACSAPRPGRSGRRQPAQTPPDDKPMPREYSSGPCEPRFCMLMSPHEPRYRLSDRSDPPAWHAPRPVGSSPARVRTAARALQPAASLWNDAPPAVLSANSAAVRVCVCACVCVCVCARARASARM